jgi:hypothetical protein
MGVPIKVAKNIIKKLPTIALIKPPLEPGGGVLSMNIVRLIPPNPFKIRVNNIQPRKNNAIVKANV